MRQIRDKVALVTGAANGIGRALALSLAGEGAHLFLVDIDEGGLKQTGLLARAHGVEVDLCVADLSLTGEVDHVCDALMDTWSGLDILVNNAGMAYYGPTEQMSEAQWERLLGVNLHAPVRFTQRLLPPLLARGEAHVVNMCSIAGLVTAPRLTAYQVSKFALVGLSRSLRAEYSRRGLGVTAICPGLVRTRIFDEAMFAPDRRMPHYPDWLYTTPEHVAERTVRAIRRNESVVTVGRLAGSLWRLERLMPGWSTKPIDSAAAAINSL